MINMPVEIRGNQLRIRVRNPRQFTKFRTHDPGQEGRFQRLAGYSKRTGWKTQSVRYTLKDYSGYSDFLRDLMDTRELTVSQRNSAMRIAKRFYAS